MPRVRILNGPAKGRTYDIGSGEAILGREASCTLQVLDRGASRQHAKIFRLGNLYFVKDLDSRNGTIVNDNPVKQELLLNGDHIIIGNTIILYEDSGARNAPERRVFADQLVEGEEELGFPTQNFPEEGTNTLELRLDDLADIEDGPSGRLSANFRAVYRLGSIVTSGKSEEALLEEAFNFIQGILPADNIYLFLRDDQSGKLLPRNYRERVKAAGVSRSIIRRALSEARSILTTDASRDVRFKAEDSVVMNKVRSVICVPLTIQERVNGVLYLASLRPDQPFNEDDLQLMTVVGALMGAALHGILMTRRQRETFFSAIRTLVSLNEMREPDSQGHAERVARWSVEIGRKIKLDERDLSRLRLAALLHDIGKAAVPEQILDSIGAENADQVHEHVLFGAQLAANIAGAQEIAPAIKHHHECFDGTGFPNALSGDDIPLFSSIIAVADHIDHTLGMDSNPETLHTSRAQLREQSGRKYNPKVVDAGLEVLAGLEA